jgi:hypothetical protein
MCNFVCKRVTQGAANVNALPRLWVMKLYQTVGHLLKILHHTIGARIRISILAAAFGVQIHEFIGYTHVLSRRKRSDTRRMNQAGLRM